MSTRQWLLAVGLLLAAWAVGAATGEMGFALFGCKRHLDSTTNPSTTQVKKVGTTPAEPAGECPRALVSIGHLPFSSLTARTRKITSADGAFT